MENSGNAPKGHGTVRLIDLTPSQRRLILALLDAGKTGLRQADQAAAQNTR